MFKLFKKKCPICKMGLEKGKDYPEGFGKKFCSEECWEIFRKKLAQEQSKTAGKGCCH